MTSQLVSSQAHKGVLSVNCVGSVFVGHYSTMQSLYSDRFLLGAASVWRRRPGAGLARTCRHIQRIPLYELESGATSQLRLGWTFAPYDGITRRLYRRWNKCTGNRCGVNGRTTRISAISNLEATGLRHTSNGAENWESDSVVLDVQGMKSGSCVARVRGLLATDMRVLSVAVSLSTQTAAVRLKPSASLEAGDNLNVGGELASRLTGSGFISNPRPTGKAESVLRRKREELAREREELLKNSSGQVSFAWALGAFCFATHATHLLRAFGIHGFTGGTISNFFENPLCKGCISSVALLGPGRDILIDGIKALWRKSPNVNSLVGVGTGAFCVFSTVSFAFPHLQWDAPFLDVPVMLLAFALVGRAMDGQVRAEASRGTHDLLSTLPSKSRLVVSETVTGEPTEDEAGLNQGLVVVVDSEELRPGDYVLVLPGEVIPVDGKVINGKSVVDESMLVGNSLSVQKATGNIVSAGTVNKEGPITVEVIATGAQQAVSNVIEHVVGAQGRNLTVQRLADVLPGSSAFSIMSLSAATFFFWYFVGTFVFPDILYKDAPGLSGSAFLPSLKLATDVLVVGCLCTLGLVTPTAVLLEKSVVLASGSKVRWNALQKRSVCEDPVLLYKDGDTVAGKHDAGSPVEAIATPKAGDMGAKKNDASLINDDPKVEQSGASGKDTVVRNDDEGSLTYDSECGQPGPRGEDIIPGGNDAGPLDDNSKAEELGARGEQHGIGQDLVAGKDDEGSSTVESERRESSLSRPNLVAEKGDLGSSTVETKAEEVKQIDQGAEDKFDGGDAGERPAKKQRKKREITASKTGQKSLSKEDGEARTKTKGKKKKDPGAPKRALSAFMCFSQSVRKELKKSQPELSFSNTGRVLGEMWQTMSADEKAPFEAMAEADKGRYKREMQKWSGGDKDALAKD